MAYGFGSTYGAGSTDVVSFSTSLTLTNQVTLAFRAFLHGAGGGNLGRALEFTGTANHHVRAQSSDSTIDMTFPWTGADGQWKFPWPSFDVWHTYVMTYDASSSSNNPVWYVDGVSQTVTKAVSPGGTFETAAAGLLIGNSAAGTRAWDGMLADMAWYGRIWTPGEIDSYMAGYSTRFNTAGLIIQHDLMRESRSAFSGSTTLTGTAVQPHPRVIMPGSRRRLAMHTVAGGGGGGATAGIFPDQRGRLVLV